METRLDRIEKAIEGMLLGISELKESQKKTDEQMRRTDAKLDRIGKQLADLGLVQGEVAEELFYRNLRSLFRNRKVTFEKVRRNVKKKGKGEYDIVAVDEGRVLVVEVKNKLEKKDGERIHRGETAPVQGVVSGVCPVSGRRRDRGLGGKGGCGKICGEGGFIRGDPDR